MKLTKGVNLTNILQAAFTRADPESAKNTVKLSVFFALLESASTNAARKMLMKLILSQLESEIIEAWYYVLLPSKPGVSNSKTFKGRNVSRATAGNTEQGKCRLTN